MDEARVYAKVTRRIVPLLVLCYLAAYLDRVNVGFAKLAMQKELGLSDLAYGLGAGIFFVGYFLFEVPSNLILHRVGARPWLARIMISWAVASAIMALTGTLARLSGLGNDWVFYGLRFILGLAEAGFYPGMLLYLNYWYPARRQSGVMALLLMAQPVAFMLGGPLSGAILSSGFAAFGLAPWQWLFVFEAIPSLLLALAVLALLDNNIAQAKWLEPEEKQFLTALVAAENRQKRDYPLAALMKVGAIWRLMLIFLLVVVGYYGINFWLPTIIQQAGVGSALQVGFVTAIPYTVTLLLLWGLKRAGDFRGKYRVAAAAAILSGLGFILAQYFTASFAVSLFFMSIAIATSLIAQAIFWSFPGAVLTGAAAAGGLAFINSVGNLGGFLGPTLLGWLRQMLGSDRAGLLVLGGCSLLAGLLIALTCRGYGEPQKDGP